VVINPRVSDTGETSRIQSRSELTHMIPSRSWPNTHSASWSGGAPGGNQNPHLHNRGDILDTELFRAGPLLEVGGFGKQLEFRMTLDPLPWSGSALLVHVCQISVWRLRVPNFGLEITCAAFLSGDYVCQISV
jgi:hypothetical protein